MEIKKFAWRPIVLTSGEKIWLSIYYEHKNRYDPSTGRPPLTEMYFVWTESAQERMLRILKA